MKRFLFILFLLLSVGVQAQRHTIEYWFDRDYDHRDTMGSDSAAWRMRIDVSSLVDGIHTVNMHLRDTAGRYSSPQSFSFYKLSVGDNGSYSHEYVYWFDRDFDNRQTGQLNAGSMMLPVSSLGDGQHTLNVLVGKGAAAVVRSYPFLKLSFDGNGDYSEEYTIWFDQDYENRQTGTLASGTMILPVNSLSRGQHILNVMIGEGAVERLSSYSFNASIYDTVYVTACDSYVWFDTVIDSNGTYRKTRTATQGTNPDTLSTLHLTVNHNTSDFDTVTACESYAWTDGVTHTASGEYTHHVQNTQGCDSARHLNLTIDHHNIDVTMETRCDSAYAWHGQSYGTTGTYTWQKPQTTTCVDVDTLHLTVNHSTTGIDTIIACESHTWIDGVTYTANNSNSQYTLLNSVGCDSTAHLNLTIDHHNIQVATEVRCDTFTWHGQTYASTGTYTWQQPQINSCIDVDTLHLTVNYSTNRFDTVSSCESYTWVDGVSRVSSGNFEYLLPTLNAVGCDSTAYLHLIIDYHNISVSNEVQCDSFAWHGQTYTTSGTYTWQQPQTNTCVNVDTLHLTVNLSTRFDYDTAICDNMKYLFNNIIYEVAGVYSMTTTNAVNCDSVVTVTLYVNQTDSVSIVDTTIQGISVFFAGQPFYYTGDYTHVFSNQLACDSTVILHLTVLDSLVHWPDTVFHPRGTLYVDSVYVFDGGLYDIMHVVSSNDMMGRVIGGDGYYREGDVMKVYAMPRTGYRFERWRDNVNENPRSIIVTESNRDSVYYAEFGTDLKSSGTGIRPVESPTEMTISPMMRKNLVCDSVYTTMRDSSSYNRFGQHVLTTHVFDTLLQCIDTVELAYDAVFGRVNISSANNEHGFVVGGDGHYLDGQKSTIAAIPLAGHRFDHWSDDDTSSIRVMIMNSVVLMKVYIAYFGKTNRIDDVLGGVKVYASQSGIVVEGAEGRSVAVFDMLGRQLFNSKITNSQFTIQKSQFPVSGVYLVRVDGVPVTKIAVVR